MPDTSPLTASKISMLNTIDRKLECEDAYSTSQKETQFMTNNDKHEYTDAWYLLDKPLVELGKSTIRNYKVEYGVCLDNDNDEMLRFLITDVSTGDEYRYALNCGWIDADNRRWLGSVLASHYVQASINTKSNQMLRSREAFCKLLKTIGYER